MGLNDACYRGQKTLLYSDIISFFFFSFKGYIYYSSSSLLTGSDLFLPRAYPERMAVVNRWPVSLLLFLLFLLDLTEAKITFIILFQFPQNHKITKSQISKYPKIQQSKYPNTQIPKYQIFSNRVKPGQT